MPSLESRQPQNLATVQTYAVRSAGPATNLQGTADRAPRDNSPGSPPARRTSAPPGAAPRAQTYPREGSPPFAKPDALPSLPATVDRLACTSRSCLRAPATVLGISSDVLRLHRKKSRDDRCRLLPVPGLCLQMLPSGLSQAIKARPPIILR